MEQNQKNEYNGGDIVRITAHGHEHIGKLARLYHVLRSSTGDMLTGFLTESQRITHVLLLPEEVEFVERSDKNVQNVQ